MQRVTRKKQHEITWKAPQMMVCPSTEASTGKEIKRAFGLWHMHTCYSLPHERAPVAHAHTLLAASRARDCGTCTHATRCLMSARLWHIHTCYSLPHPWATRARAHTHTHTHTCVTHGIHCAARARVGLCVCRSLFILGLFSGRLTCAARAWGRAPCGP